MQAIYNINRCAHKPQAPVKVPFEKICDNCKSVALIFSRICVIIYIISFEGQKYELRARNQ